MQFGGDALVWGEREGPSGPKILLIKPLLRWGRAAAGAAGAAGAGAAAAAAGGLAGGTGWLSAPGTRATVAS